MLASAGLGVGLLAGCSSAVEVGLPAGASSAACKDIAWPTTAAKQDRVATNPVDPAVAAWGDPAIVARCGLAPLTPTTQDCINVDGVDWVIRPLSDGTAFTTYGTDPALEVLVPKTYAPEPMVLPDFTAAATSLPKTTHHCL